MNDIKNLFAEMEAATTFEKFFVAVSKIKLLLPRDELRKFREHLTIYKGRFSNEAVGYLQDCLDAEIVLPCNSPDERSHEEKDFRDYVMSNFAKAFPEYTSPKVEYSVSTGGRADIHAFERDSDRDVVMEFKASGVSPNGQLLSYGCAFAAPILISITKRKIPVKQQVIPIIYYTFDDIEERIKGRNASSCRKGK